MSMSLSKIQLPQLKRNSIVLLFVFLLLYALPGCCTPVLPAEIHEGILAVIEAVFSDNHKGAEEEAKKLIRRFPENPAGYFCMAFTLDNWMVKYQTDKKEDEFYRYCDLAIEKGERELAENSKNEWARFFIAGSDGFKGTYEARYERWITAFRFGWKGVSVLLDLESKGCDIPDIHFGIANYNYWRSALMKMLWWMPGIEDKRQESITELYAACENAVFTGNLAASSLVDILINEKRFADALPVLEKVMKRYPEYAPFWWKRILILYGLERYDEAIAMINRLLDRCASYTPDNHFVEIQCHAYLARIYMAQKKYSQVRTECRTIKNYELENAVKKRLDPVFSDMKALEKQAVKGAAGK